MATVISNARIKRAVFVLIAFAVVVGAAVAPYQMREITAQEYRLLRVAMKNESREAQQAIAMRMNDGKVNKWEFDAIVQTLWSGKAPAPTSTATSVAEERLVLLAMARQVAPPR